jgi:hypothetical protein
VNKGMKGGAATINANSNYLPGCPTNKHLGGLFIGQLGQSLQCR